jgi:predicted Zn-dependent peptidase
MSPAPALQPRPAVAPLAPWRFPVPRHDRLDNGVTVLTHHMPGQHVATVTCHLGIPATAEPDGCDGITAVMAACLGRGAHGITAREFEQRAAAAGITWTASPGWTGPSITLELPARQLPSALDLLYWAVAEPAFDPAEVAGQVQLAAAAIAGAAAAPGTRVLQELPAAVYEDGSRAARPAEGTLATVAQLTPAMIARYYDQQVRPAATTIVIAGDLAGLDTTRLAEQAFGIWRDNRPAGGGGSLLTDPVPLPRQQPSAVLVDQPGAAQTQLLLAVPVPGRGHPGWNALQVAARILGAPLTGRLDAQVREGSGDSYTVQAGLTELIPGAGLLLVTGAVDGPATPGALAAIKDVLAAPLRDGFTPAEHAAAAGAIAGTLPLAYETPAALAAITADLAACGLAPDYLDVLLDDIAGLSAEVVNGAYKSHLGPERLTLIAVGDAAVLAGPLRELAAPAELQVISA